MKRERMTFAVCSSAVLLGSVISFACVMCLAEAFDLLCSPRQLILLCCLVSGVAAAGMSLKHSGVFGLCVFVAYFFVLIWKGPVLLSGVQTLLYHVTEAYAKCFEDVVILGEPGGDTRWLLSALAVPLAWLSVWTVCREGYTAFVALACVPFLVLCLIVVDLAPVLWLILLTAALILLLLSGSARLHSAGEGGRLIWWLAPPVMILICVLMTVSPVESYVRSGWSADLQQIAEGNFDFSLWRNKVTTAITAGWGGDLKTVDLNKVGPKAKTGVYALQYRSDIPVSYLRGSSLGRYENNTWYDVELPGPFLAEHTQLIHPSSEFETVLIETNVGEPLFYTAYYPAEVPENGMAVHDAYLENPEKTRGYAVRFSPNSDPQISPEYEAYVRETYLQLPGDLQGPLNQYLQSHELTDATAAAIADAVRASGVYDLNTPAVPDEKDFVLYFLNESHQGYCVHFATATVLLLRSAGIPARYVSGYAAEGPAGQWNEVTQDDAHAWVEFYADGMGWLPLDPTPADYHAQSELSASNTPEPEPPRPQQGEPTREHTQQPAEEAARSSARVWLWLMILPGAVLFLLLRRAAICFCRRVYFSRQKHNRKALELWNRLLQMYTVQGVQIPERWICLAEKAKFSQHTITDEELSLLSRDMEEQIRCLKQRPLLHILWHKYILVLY